MLIAGASVAYLGPFTPRFRQLIHKAWCLSLDKGDLVHSTNCNITATLLVILPSWDPDTCACIASYL
jgi:hypothetical protein